MSLGDVALFKSAGGKRFTCHRILATKGRNARFGFRGDAFTAPLEWVDAGQLIGRAIERDGFPVATAFLRGKGLMHAWVRWGLARSRMALGRWRKRWINLPRR